MIPTIRSVHHNANNSWYTAYGYYKFFATPRLSAPLLPVLYIEHLLSQSIFVERNNIPRVPHILMELGNELFASQADKAEASTT